MLLLLGFAFISGLVTILAPCIWPLLPIILSTSLGGSKAKSFGITLGIMVSFAVFTLSVSYLVSAFGLDPNSLRIVAVFVLVFLGLTMVLPPLARFVEAGVSRLSGKFGGTNTRSGFMGGFLTGATLGIIWTPCAGPILAAIATLAATSQVNFGIILVTIVYVTGVGIPLFFFSYAGQKFFGNTRFLSKYTGRVQQVFGIILLVTAAAIYTNYDKVIQAKLLDVFPQYSSALTAFESNSAVTNELSRLKGSSNQEALEADTSGLFNVKNGPTAPEFSGITNWLNAKPLTMQELRGKVVLVDFWTYTCINCIRTLPHVTAWYDKYKDKGFVVVGVHTPEFAFEKETNNVAQAIKQYGIHYPVAQDNDYGTWTAYSNQYWPAEYLIDAKGVIRRAHFGEGEYPEMEKAIQLLLKEAGKKVSGTLSKMPDETPHGRISPETYVGSERMEFESPDGNTGNLTKTFGAQSEIPLNQFTFENEWTITNNDATSGKKAALVYHFLAQNVYLVMRPPKTGSGIVKVLLDGKPISPASAGNDVHGGVITVTTDRLYSLVHLPDIEEHTLRLEFETPGTQAYAFTFG